MRGKSHATIGLLSAIQISLLFKIPIGVFDMIVATVFSLLPDLDQPNSIVSKYIFKTEISKWIYKAFIFIINSVIFFITIKIDNNFFVSAIATFIAIELISGKITHGTIRKVFLTLIFVLLSLVLYMIKVPIQYVLLTLFFSIFPWFKHRSFSHSLFCVGLVYFLMSQIEMISSIENLALYSTIGYSSHIFLGDIFTKQGVPFFYPIDDKKISIGFLKVGGKLSNFLEILFIVLLFCSVTFSLYNM
ncbi:MAG: metal-dependent hydrolase [Clostridioides sp.]|jgi:inner membrane protein|nr:metal-dependent hydrolase [Clostridioides sp.]